MSLLDEFKKPGWEFFARILTSIILFPLAYGLGGFTGLAFPYGSLWGTIYGFAWLIGIVVGFCIFISSFVAFFRKNGDFQAAQKKIDTVILIELLYICSPLLVILFLNIS